MCVVESTRRDDVGGDEHLLCADLWVFLQVPKGITRENRTERRNQREIGRLEE